MYCSPDKEVYYDKYCKICKHWDLPENEEPCYDCLQEPVNTYSHKPVYWEARSLDDLKKVPLGK